MITLPKIEILFKQLAATLIERSSRGVAVLVMRDDTNKTFNYKEYKNVTEANSDSALYKAANLQYIKDTLSFALNKVVVVRIDEADAVTDALVILEKRIRTGWITVADGTSQDFADLASWIKSKELEKKTYKAVTYKAATTDCKHVVNFYNDKVTFVDSRGEVTGEKYCPSIAGIIAACNVEKGTTYFKCSNLTNVQEVSDNEAAVASGKFILINDMDVVKIALGINSMTTIDGMNNTEDMKYIDTVECMDMIADDVAAVFKDEYLGNYKNSYDNQILFISSVNSYFGELAKEEVLDDGHSNKADVNVEAQRSAWIASGKADAANWTDAQVKNNAFKRSVFLGGDIKVLGAMENLHLDISLF